MSDEKMGPGVGCALFAVGAVAEIVCVAILASLPPLAVACLAMAAVTALPFVYMVAKGNQGDQPMYTLKQAHRIGDQNAKDVDRKAEKKAREKTKKEKERAAMEKEVAESHTPEAAPLPERQALVNQQGSGTQYL